MTIPEGWAAASLGDLADFVMGQAPPGDACNFDGIGTPFVKAGEFGAQRPLIREWTTKPLKMARAEDVLICVVGATSGKLNLGADCAIGRSVAAIRLSEATSAEFIYPRLKSEVTRLRASSTGTAQGVLSKEMLAAIEVALPPLAEQRRILTKLDVLVARMKSSREELERVSLLAKNLRQIVVTSAFRGELTAKWRSENPHQAPLSRDQTAAAFASIAGVERKRSPVEIDWRPEIALPPTWRWAPVDELVGLVQYGTSAKTSDDEGVPVLRMGNIQRGELDWANLKYLPADHSEFPQLLLADGDVLFNRTNSADLVGKSAVFRGHPQPVSFASYLIRVRCSAILPDLLARYVNSPFGRAWASRSASQQVGQANINGSKLKALGIPLPPPGEQEEMLRLIGLAFARADRLEAEAVRARALLDRLEAAILARAFRGELVPQDPNDEPAGVLLDRIRAQRAAAPRPRRGRQVLEPAQA